MSPALRKRPFRLACAAATSVSALQRPEPDHTIPAPARRQPRPPIGSGR
ncbi:hypothetical protein RKD20_007814 [Streptomyces sp. SLBN-8D4]|jgi:hypothetical protein